MATIQKIPYAGRGRSLFALMIAEFIAIWIVILFAVHTLPSVVPTHFNLNGMPDAYGSSSTYLLVGGLLSIAPLIIMLVAYYRFTLINDYPYLVNMPYFYSKIQRMKPNRQSYWINRYFEIYLALGAYISAVLFVLVVMLYSASMSNFFSGLGLVLAMMLALVGVIILWLWILRSMSKEMDAELGRKRK